MWAYVCLGLRSPDLSRIIFNYKGEYPKFFKIIENKNKHEAMRYIPKSLTYMAIASKSVYPITQIRQR
jgi:hypothetical protein